MSAYQPKTGQRCACKRGVQRDNCPACEGTGWMIDFAAIRARRKPDAPIEDRPCAAPGLTSYRYPSNYGGWIMIGARNEADALNEAQRSLSYGTPTRDKLEIWCGSCYLPVAK